MKRFSKILSVFLMICLLLTSIPVDVEAASVSKPKCPKKMTLTVGQKKVIKVKGKNIKKKTFKSTNKKVATVNKKGRVTAKKKGKCTIKIKVKYKKTKSSKKYLTKTLKCKVTVKAKKKTTETVVKKPVVTTKKVETTTKETNKPSSSTEISSEEVSSKDETSSEEETSSSEETSSEDETSSSEEESTSKNDEGTITSDGEIYKVFWGSNEFVIEKEHYVEVSKGDVSHSHVLNSRIIVQPTCTEDGYVKYSCSCGYEFKDTSLGKTSGHSYKLVSEKSDVVNCGNKTGVHVYVCVACGDEKTETVTCDDEHIYSDWRVIKSPTCIEVGSQERQCRVCGDIEEEEISALGHNYTDSVIVNDPTCNANGYSVQICKICDDHKYNVISALGHNYSWVIVKESTCTETGIKQNICSECNDVSETQNIEPLGHTESDWEIVKDSTCIEVGSRRKTCVTCGVLLTEDEIPLKEHIESDWIITSQPTCTKNGSQEKHCKMCDVVLETETLPALGHAESDWKVVIEPTCLDRGKRVKTCSVCNSTVIAEDIYPLGHASGERVVEKEPTCTEDGVYAIKCSRQGCGGIATKGNIPALGHQAGADVGRNPTCTESGDELHLCTRCHVQVGEHKTLPALGHNYSLVYEKSGSDLVSAVSTKAVCSRCNDTINLGKDGAGCTFGAHAWCIELINKDYDGRPIIYIHCAECGCHAPTTQSFADACELEAHEYKVSDDSTITNRVIECIHCGIKKNASDFPSGVLCERYGLHELDESCPYEYCSTCNGTYFNSKCKGAMTCDDTLIEEREDIRGTTYIYLYEKYICASCRTYHKKNYANFSASAGSSGDYMTMLRSVSEAKSSWVRPTEAIACTQVCGDCLNSPSEIIDYTNVYEGDKVFYHCSYCNRYVRHIVSGNETWYTEN